MTPTKKTSKKSTSTKTQMAEKLESAGITSAPESQSSTSETAITSAKPIALTYERINKALSGWSPTETNDAMETIKFSISKMVEGAESKMAVGTKFNDFEKTHGAEKCRVLIKETSSLGINGLSENNITLWRKRSAMLLVEYPNPIIRRYVLALTGGEGLIVRDESFDKKDSSGVALPKPYILSPYYAQAAEKHADLIKASQETTSEDVAEKVARTLFSTASGLRTSARNKPEDARIRDAFQSFRKRMKGWIGKHESLVWDELFKTCKAAVQETDDLELVGAFIGKVDKAYNGADELNKAESNGQAKGRAA